MLKLVVAPEAEQDMIDIWAYIAKDQIINADRFIERLQQKLNSLTELGEIGTKRDNVIKGLRSIPFHNYVLFYRVNEETLEVVRVLHGSREIDQFF